MGLGGMSHAVARVVRLARWMAGGVMIVGGEGGGGRWCRVVEGLRERVLQRKKLRVGGQAGGS